MYTEVLVSKLLFSYNYNTCRYVNMTKSSLAGHTKNTYGDYGQVFVRGSGMLELPIRFDLSHASPQEFNYKYHRLITLRNIK